MSIFIAGPVRPLNSVIKSQVYLKCAIQISRFFSVNRTYVHVRRNVGETLSLSYIPSYMHIRPVYREKSADLQGTVQVCLRFYNKISRSYSPCNKNLHAHFLCWHAGYLQTHPCLKGNLRET